MIYMIHDQFKIAWNTICKKKKQLLKLVKKTNHRKQQLNKKQPTTTSNQEHAEGPRDLQGIVGPITPKLYNPRLLHGVPNQTGKMGPRLGSSAFSPWGWNCWFFMLLFESGAGDCGKTTEKTQNKWITTNYRISNTNDWYGTSLRKGCHRSRKTVLHYAETAATCSPCRVHWMEARRWSASAWWQSPTMTFCAISS